ncbi:ribokinase [Candidatus Gastranaerophilus sp. (ex Termes propinquus)]|nr:ribokinase [Candidatus Gastranaerophilus sp. (ex Termes propinquus)]
MFDIVTIGSATRDTFIESNKASILSVSAVDRHAEYLCFPYGSKVDLDNFYRDDGGGGLNTAVNFAKLGFKTTTVVKVGSDEVGTAILKDLPEKGVDSSNVVVDKERATGFSIILVSFQGDRTVLAHRGANAHIQEADINLKNIKAAKWLYVAPLAGDSNKVLNKIATFAEKNNVKLALNAGTTGILKGEKYFSHILKTAEIFVLNKEEAMLLTKLPVRPDTKKEAFSTMPIHPDIATIIKRIKSITSGVVVLTDGKNGCWAYDGTKFYIAPMFPAKVKTTLGAGDAFTSTFVGAMEKFGDDIEKSLKYASVSAASVVEYYGAQEGFLTFEQIEKRLVGHPDYKITVF